jgi:hypothetical protein
MLQPLPGATNQLMSLLLPWAGQPVGFALSQAPDGIDGLFVPTGAAATSFLSNEIAGYPLGNASVLNGYTDPSTGQPMIASSSDQGGTLSIWQLPSVPGAMPSPDAG